MRGVGVFKLPKEQPRATSFPLRIHGKYLEDQNHTPFLMVGDAAWSLISQLSKADALTYLHDRQARGFNTVIVNLIEHKFATNHPANFYGDAPFTVTGDFSTPNEAYFAHADWVISQAAAMGILIVLAPMYLGFGCGDEGWCAEVQSNSTANCTGYGQYIGSRYQAFDNIIWCHGGDVDGSLVISKVDAIANGIKANDTIKPKLHTAHSQRFHMAVTDYDRSWLDVNTTYSDKTQGLSDAQASWTSYQSTARPFFLVEGDYEGTSLATATECRKQAYWSLFSGSFGHIYGNCPIWGFNSPLAIGFCDDGTNWTDWLGSAAAQSMTVMTKILKGIRWHDMVPDTGHTVMTAGYSTDVAVGQTPDGQQLLAYLPSSRAVTIDLTKFAGAQVYVTWIDPATARQASEGVFAPSAGSKTFTPPVAGDWVLRIMDIPVKRRFFFPMENVAEFSLFETSDPDSTQELSTTQVFAGRFSHRGHAINQRAANNDGANQLIPHRAYPLIYHDDAPIKTPAKITLWVWTDITLVDRSPNISDWFSFATFSADVVWKRVVTINLRLDTANGKYYVYSEHVPDFASTSQVYQASAGNGGQDFPRSQWVKLEIYYHADNDCGTIRVFQDGVLVSYALVNDGNGHIYREHFGFYASAAVAAGSQVFNDNLLIEEFAI